MLFQLQKYICLLPCGGLMSEFVKENFRAEEGLAGINVERRQVQAADWSEEGPLGSSAVRVDVIGNSPAKMLDLEQQCFARYEV